MTGDLGRKVESREIKHCHPDTRSQVPPGQCNAHCCTPIRHKPCRLFSTQIQEKISSNSSYYFIFSISLFFYTVALSWKRQWSKSQGTKQERHFTSEEGTELPAQHSPASPGDRGACADSCHKTLLSQLGQDSPWTCL